MMVDKYVPKVGDKVRATLGENKLEGVIHYMAESASVRSWMIEPDGVEDVDPYLLSAADGWQFEQIVSVPTKFGAVIRRADGRTFVRDFRLGDEGRYPWSGMTRSQGYSNDEQVSNGGFTVLFDGVDA